MIITRMVCRGLAVAMGAVAVASGVGAGPAAAWLHIGIETRYPAEGGTWQYGFSDAKVRSYYTQKTVTHGSSVKFNGSLTRSICTAAGQRSVAEAWAVNSAISNDAYYYRVC